MREHPPTAALVLGLAGLLPLLATILFELVIGPDGDPRYSSLVIAMPGLGYAALILSFVGGMWWSAACGRVDGRRLWCWLGVAVAPSLWAAASFLAGPPRGTGAALAAGLVLALLADRAAVRAALVPSWWMRLRVPLSCGLALETLAVAWLA